MDTPFKTHLLLLGSKVESQAVPHLDGFAREIDGTIARHVSSLSASDAVFALRARVGSEPLGVLAADESECLDAITAGADDATVVTQLEITGFAAFFDRVQLRARIRADRERLAESLAQSEKLTALGTLVAGIGHEINNPLTAISLSIEMARRVVVPMLTTAQEIEKLHGSRGSVSQATLSRWREAVQIGRFQRDANGVLDDISSATSHIATIVSDLRVFAQTDSRERSVLIDLRSLVDQAIRLVGRQISTVGVLEFDFPEGVPPVLVPSSRVVQVLTNLLVNASHAIREQPRDLHRVRIGARVDDEFVALSVSDTGPGVPAEAVERIFDPFYTTKRQELGTGLGLSISRSILRGIGGDLVVDSVYGEGATFICLIPRPPAGFAADAYVRSAAPPPAVLPERHLSVLFVDDDERVLRAASRALAPLHRVCLARDADEALALLASGTHADVVVAEMEPADSGARVLLERLAESNSPLARRTIFTCSTREDDREIIVAGIRPMVLDKPIRANALLEAIDRVVVRAGDLPASGRTRSS